MIYDIYAVGDAIVVKQQVSGEDALISLASPANRQGRQVADVIAGLARTNRGSIGTALVRVFDLAAASTGLSERVVKQLGLNYQVVHVSVGVGYHQNDHRSLAACSPAPSGAFFSSMEGILPQNG